MSVIELSYTEILRMMRLEPSLLESEAEEALKRGIKAFQASVEFSFYERVVSIAETEFLSYPPAAKRLAGCVSALVGISTIGQAASDMIVRANASGDYVCAIAYDTMANYFVTQYNCIRLRGVRADYIKHGIYLTKEITPGNNCDLSLQKEIFRLLPDAGVKLSDSLMMTPVKSLSYVYGITEVPNNFGVSHDCSECMAKNCIHRSKERVWIEANEEK